MKKQQLPDFAFPALSAPGIGEKNTISNGPDDGNLNCNTSHFWNPMRHGTTKQAVDNGLTAALLSVNPAPPVIQLFSGAGSSGALNISGHGNEGLIETGMGQNGGFDNAKIILSWNSWAWGPELDRINPSNITYLSLWACHPGAGPDGAELLYQMAQRCGRAVRGGTGFLYCSSQNMWWENGSQWQVATPTNKPNPIPAPTPHSIMSQPILFEVKGQDLGIGDVSGLDVTMESFGVQFLRRTKSIPAMEAQHILASLIGSPPMEMNFGVAAMVTATLVVHFKNGADATFKIYNDRLAVDRASNTGYYISSVARLDAML